jgi:hypothetical protein
LTFRSLGIAITAIGVACGCTATPPQPTTITLDNGAVGIVLPTASSPQELKESAAKACPGQSFAIRYQTVKTEVVRSTGGGPATVVDHSGGQFGRAEGAEPRTLYNGVAECGAHGGDSVTLPTVRE